jgi:hypothetical protein
MGLSTHAQTNTKSDDPSGDWKGTCTKITGTSSWDVDLAIRNDGTYRWTASFPATQDNPGWTAGHTGTVDRTSGQLIENEPEHKIFANYSVDGRRMRVDPENGMSRCSFTR